MRDAVKVASHQYWFFFLLYMPEFSDPWSPNSWRSREAQIQLATENQNKSRAKQIGKKTQQCEKNRRAWKGCQNKLTRMQLKFCGAAARPTIHPFRLYPQCFAFTFFHKCIIPTEKKRSPESVRSRKQITPQMSVHSTRQHVHCRYLYKRFGSN